MASGPPSALACPGCKGKYTLLNPGEVHCEVCSSVFQLSRLVWGTRFPTGLRQNAARAVHSCYLQLLQEADQYYIYAQAAAAGCGTGSWSGGALLVPERPGEVDKRPAEAAPKNTETAAKEAQSSRENKSNTAKDREAKSKKSKKSSRGKEEKKERKKHRREEESELREKALPVKVELPEDEKDRTCLAEATTALSGEEDEECQAEESEESEEEVSVSKSPIRRRPQPDAPQPVRPRSPIGSPPRSATGRWEGIIPAGRRAATPPGPPPGEGLVPKSKARKKKKKNKGVKHRERQERRRSERQGGHSAR